MITRRTYTASIPRDLQLEIELGAAIVAAQGIAARLRELGHHEAAEAALTHVKQLIEREVAASPVAATRAVLSVKE